MSIKKYRVWYKQDFQRKVEFVEAATGNEAMDKVKEMHPDCKPTKAWLEWK